MAYEIHKSLFADSPDRIPLAIDPALAKKGRSTHQSRRTADIKKTGGAQPQHQPSRRNCYPVGKGTGCRSFENRHLGTFVFLHMEYLFSAAGF